MVNCDKCNAPDVFDRSEISNMEFKRGIKQGRVEGMKQELKDTLTTLKAIDSELDRRNVDMMLKTLIKVKEKRLKKLEKKVLKNV